MLRKILRVIFAFLFRVLTRTEVIGLENIPKQGGFILCPNHLGIMDAPVVFIYVKNEKLTGLVAKKHQKNPLLRPLINSVGGIWLNRDEVDTHAIRVAREHLQSGGGLGIAPEGTRSRTGALIKAKTGAAYMAEKGGAPVVPVGITGTEHGLKKAFTFQRPRIKVVFGKPFLLPPMDRRDRDGCLERNTDEIMCQIAALLPPKYWGVYADHPRLLELVAAAKIQG